MYAIDQSPLYKLQTQKKLAELLRVTPSTLRELCTHPEQHYKFFSIDQGGKSRPISKPIGEMEVAHDRLFGLLRRIETPDYLHSGVRGRSYMTNAREHRGHRQVFTVDIKGFFPAVSPKRIHDLFGEDLKCAPDVAWLLTEICMARGHLPTGSSISQVVAFHAYRSMFDALADRAAQQSLTMTCYVDDVTFSGVHVTDLFQHDVRTIIRRANLIPHKDRFYGHTKPKRITGVMVVGNELRVRNEHQQLIYERIQQFQGMPPGKDRDQLWKELVGRLHAAGLVQPEFKKRVKALRKNNPPILPALIP